MLKHRTRLILPAVALAAAGFAHADPVLPPEIYLYTDSLGTKGFLYDDPSYQELNPSDWQDGDPQWYYEGHPGRYTGVGTASSRWTLGQTGNYTVQIHWAVHTTAHANDALYAFTSASGTQDFHINQRQRANQGAVPDSLDPSYSGWYTLGQNVALDANSRIDLSFGAGNTGGLLIGNAVRLAQGVDVVVDEQAHATIQGPSGAFGSAIDRNAGTFPNGPISGYKYTLTNDKDAGGGYIEYTLGGVTGASDVWISWGTHPAHSPDALFLFDQDGNFGTLGDQVSTHRDLTKFADGTPDAGGSNGIWSGYSYFGQFNLLAGSRIRILNDSGTTTYVTGDAFRVVNVIPEPAGAALLALSGGLVMLRRKR